MQVIKGISGSKGQVTGMAKVLVDINEVDQFAPGDILVTVATSPVWTPVMRLAAAIVTDIGGSLSHAAIIAREFGIPAVVGTKNATELIKSGQRIQVDGDKGIVEIIK